MDYTKTIDKVLALKVPAYYSDERKAVMQHVVVDADNHRLVAINPFVTFRVRDENLETQTIDEFTAKHLDIISRYESLHVGVPAPVDVVSKVIKAHLKPIRQQKQDVAVIMDENSLMVMSKPDDGSAPTLLYRIGLSGEHTHANKPIIVNKKYLLLMLEHIADVQRADKRAHISINVMGENQPLTVLTPDTFMAIAVVRTNW